MDFHELKKSVESIEISKDMQERIIRNCKSNMTQHKEEYTMKKNRTFKRPTAVAAAMSLCICLSIAATKRLLEKYHVDSEKELGGEIQK